MCGEEVYVQVVRRIEGVDDGSGVDGELAVRTDTRIKKERKKRGKRRLKRRYTARSAEKHKEN